jgi:hypothetical protein
VLATDVAPPPVCPPNVQADVVARCPTGWPPSAQAALVIAICICPSSSKSVFNVVKVGAMSSRQGSAPSPAPSPLDFVLTCVSVTDSEIDQRLAGGVRDDGGRPSVVTA